MASWSEARRRVVLLVSLVVVLVGCGSEGGVAGSTSDDDRPTVVVTTNILGDVVGELIGGQANVVTIMPVGADPHDFQPSAQEVAQVLDADALVTNGTDFEEGLLEIIESAQEAGVPIFEATSAVTTIEFGGVGHDEHGEDEDHEDEDHDETEDHNEHDEEGHHSGVDPHFFTDPVRMTDAVEGIRSFLAAEVDGLDEAALDTSTAAYLTELDELHAEVTKLVEAIPEDRRVLVTNHEVFGYFADRYGFEVVGAVIPGGTTVESASAGDLAELAEIIEHEGVPAIFAETSSSNALVETLATEVGDVEVVELFAESLGNADSEGATYLSMIRTNASRISTALS